jgi:hypothetical protein
MASRKGASSASRQAAGQDAQGVNVRLRLEPVFGLAFLPGNQIDLWRKFKPRKWWRDSLRIMWV